ncbi:hypothetical protein JZ751_010511 [Albula glossodonta]|uniref:Prospero domain-containing protein n=1 Tax=Albula glossodonta TaxID=121402 RepID=A0A8T2P5E0_9TELE|nr:hypothetical protein JZ751_010511 [Albula glossodonta]
MNLSVFDSGMCASSVPSWEVDKATLQQRDMDLCGDSLTSIISRVLQRNIQNRRAVREGISYLPAAVPSCTPAEPGREDQSNKPPLSPNRHSSTLASPETDLQLNERCQAKRSRVENIIQGMSGSSNARAPRRGEKSNMGTGGGEETLKGNKRKARLSQREGGGCGGEQEERVSLRRQLWAMQWLLQELQQRFLQVYSPNTSQAEDTEQGTTGSLQCGDAKKDTPIPVTHMHNNCELEWGTTMDRQQATQADGIHSVFNEGHKNLPEALKHELSKAVSKSVDLVFENLSPTLFYQPPQANLRSAAPAPSYMQPKYNTQIPSGQEPHLDKEQIESTYLGFYEKSKVPMTVSQTEALSLVIGRPSLAHCCSVDQMAPLELNPPSSSQEDQVPVHLLNHAPHGTPAKLPCLANTTNEVSLTWGEMKVRPNQIKLPAAQGLEAAVSPHVSMKSRDQQTIGEGNLYTAPNFNRCITSQLIKWFSNFREFYYIQMEKFARHSIMDGVKDMKDLSVTRDSELFRALNAHFNKANDFQVPDRFLEVAEITLKEFFSAISLAKDFDPSWKKAIYKVICKLDCTVPEVFKSTVCL